MSYSFYNFIKVSKELYHRFTEIYLPGQPDIKNNELFSGLINNQIEAFVKQNNISSYRIINCETQAIPTSSFPKLDIYTGYVMLIMHLAYNID